MKAKLYNKPSQFLHLFTHNYKLSCMFKMSTMIVLPVILSIFLVEVISKIEE